MKLDTDFMIQLLQIFEEADDVHVPVRLIAVKINDLDNLDAADVGKDCISNKLVKHLLHLQDLGAIQNLRGDCSWGYEPLGEDYGETMDDGFEELVKESITRGEFETPHCYLGDQPESVIRLTAMGIQLRETLTSSVLESGVKEAAMIFGKSVIAGASKLLLEAVT